MALGNKIKGGELPLIDIFSSHYDFDIPSYQRPYAWTEDEVGKLFEDLYDFYKENDNDEEYFLGSVVLIKEENKPHSDVIDGQQRLTTLTILLSVLASKVSGDVKTAFTKYIIEPGDPVAQYPSRPRLRLRKREADFFEQYVQNMDFDALFQLDPERQDTEAKANIIKNAKLLMQHVTTHFVTEDDITKFGTFLVKRCFLVVVSTPSEKSAFRVFSVMNDRGLSLLPTDIIKADIIGSLPYDKQTVYTDEWEQTEAALGRAGFNDLFGQIRMIKLKTKPRKSIQEEFNKYILPDINAVTAVDFLENTLFPYADAYLDIKKCKYEATHGADDVNDILQWLNRIDNTDWLPVAMLYYRKYNDDPEKLCAFLKKLERRAAFMRTVSYDINKRIDVYGKILSELESSNDGSFGSAIELTDLEKQDFLRQLNGDIYTMTGKKRNYLILRLDSFVADGAASYDSKVLTIEHVLPQTVAAGSEWEKWWDDEDKRTEYVHKIGNLVPLTKRHNSEAQNYDFCVKKTKYFTSKSGVASYALTTQVLRYDEWTPAKVEARQRELLEEYKKHWDL